MLLLLNNQKLNIIHDLIMLLQVSPKAQRVVACSAAGDLRVSITPDLAFNGIASADTVVLDEASFGDGFSRLKQESSKWSGCLFQNSPLRIYPSSSPNSARTAHISLSSASGSVRVMAQSWQSRVEGQIRALLKH